MVKRTALIVALSLIVSISLFSCAAHRHHYSHPIKSSAEIDFAHMECVQQAEIAVAGQTNAFIRADDRARIIKRCMVLKGYSYK